MTANARIFDFEIKKFNDADKAFCRIMDTGPIKRIPTMDPIRIVRNGTMNCFNTAGMCFLKEISNLEANHVISMIGIKVEV